MTITMYSPFNPHTYTDMKHTIIMIRTYETSIEVEADTEFEAYEKAVSHPDRYALELEQCCITDEKYINEKNME